jgi:hypothetical protein
MKLDQGKIHTKGYVCCLGAETFMQTDRPGQNRMLVSCHEIHVATRLGQRRFMVRLSEKATHATRGRDILGLVIQLLFTLYS